MHHIFFVLAQEEVSGEVGPLARACIEEAVKEYYVMPSPRCHNAHFAFGAGNGCGNDQRSTLASKCERYLRTIAPTMCGSAVFTNHDQKYVDILGQLSWLVRTLHWWLPRKECQVHLFGSPGQLRHAKLVLRLFFPRGTYHLHPIKMSSKFGLFEEIMEDLYLLLVRWGGVSSRCGRL